MKSTLAALVGFLMAAAGLGILGWLWLVAETTGRGMQLGVKVLDVPVPAMLPGAVAISLWVLGLVIGFGHDGTTARQDSR